MRFDLAEGQEVAIADPRVNQLRLTPTALADLPDKLVLLPNYPNPFNTTTTIQYALPEATEVLIEVYNIFGQRLGVLHEGEQKAGHHKIAWDARTSGNQRLASGVYFYVIQANSERIARKMMLVK